MDAAADLHRNGVQVLALVGVVRHVQRRCVNVRPR